MISQPLIIITNDDGINSGGLRVAAEAVRQLGNVLIVAPKSQQTGMGRSFPRTKNQGVIELHRGSLGNETITYYAVEGSPAQAVAHGILEIASRRPNLCISGINNGENLGGTNLISGTLGAALEASSFGIPALAVSIGPENQTLFKAPYRIEDWITPLGIIRRLAGAVLRNGLPAQVSVLNINIPGSAKPDTPIRITRQSRYAHYVCAAPGPRDLSKPMRLPVVEQLDIDNLEPDSDLYAFFVDKAISITPMAGDLTVCNENGKPIDLFLEDSL
uniref:5'/3'-nucleotidase SurE n=1 Tax=Candidatus Electrothrix sp. TaxID=2170559 RepID=UPI004057410F